MKNNKSKIFVFLNDSVMNLMILVILLNTSKTDIFFTFFVIDGLVQCHPEKAIFIRNTFQIRCFEWKECVTENNREYYLKESFSPVFIGLNNWYIETKMKLKMKIKLDHVCKIEKENDFLFLLIFLFIWANIPFCILMIKN